MMRYKLVILLSVLALTHSFSSIGQNLGIHPTTLYFSLAAGQAETQVINVSNSSPKKVQYRLYLNDWLRDSIGGHQYLDPGSLTRSCSKWITLNKNFVEIEPGQTTQITVKLQIPETQEATKEMKWAMLFIETVEEAQSAANKTAQATVRNLLRLGVHVYQTPPTVTDKEVAIDTLLPYKEMANAYSIIMRNTGKTMLECKSYLELTGTDGKKTKLPVVEFPVFPEQRRYITFELPRNMPKGKYSVLGVVDGGEDISLQAIESEITVK